MGWGQRGAACLGAEGDVEELGVDAAPAAGEPAQRQRRAADIAGRHPKQHPRARAAAGRGRHAHAAPPCVALARQHAELWHAPVKARVALLYSPLPAALAAWAALARIN